MYGRLFAKLFGDTDPLLIFPIISLTIFVVTFTLVIVRVMRKSKEEMTMMAQMPLQESDMETEGSAS
jgi:hypothetical protein